MYAVIFRATTKNLDQEYYATAESLRDLALSKYGCLDFVSVAEKDQEITISYWENQEQIKRWKADPQHAQAQARGRERWYSDYTVQVVRIEREYTKGQ